MKTLQQVKNEITELRQEIKELEKSQTKKDIALRKRLRKKIPILNELVLYL
jgi:hypothetical protein